MISDDNKGRVFVEAKKGYIDLAYMETLGIEFCITTGFADGASELFDNIELNPKLVPNLFFPACFLFRHYVELQCKRLIQISNQIRGTGKDERGHDLNELWKRARIEVKYHVPEVKEETHDMVAELIDQFVEVDPTGEHFRYWRTIKGEETLPTLPGRISIQNLRGWMYVIETILDDYAEHLLEMADEKLGEEDEGQ